MINYNFFQGDTHSVSVAPDFTTFRRNYIRDNVDKGEWKTVQTSPARRSDDVSGLKVSMVEQQRVSPQASGSGQELSASYTISPTEETGSDYLLVYITAGSGRLFLNNCERGGVKIKNGMLCWLSPKYWYALKPDAEAGWTVCYLACRGTMLDQFIRRSMLDGKNNILELGMNEELIHLFKRAREVKDSEETFAQTYLTGIVLHMVGLILAQAQPPCDEPRENEQKMEQAVLLMKENVMNDIDMNQLAVSLGFSYSWFRKLFKDYSGMSPAKFFLELKLKKIKELLISTDMPIKELLYSLNCSTLENFYTTFKKHTGYTPSEYRKRMAADHTNTTDEKP